MRNIFVVFSFISLLICSVQIKAQSNISSMLIDYEPFVKSNVLRDGKYNATVKYVSHTGYEATYSVVVSVKNDRVVAIYFSNGGSVHNGYNSEGYSYNGGKLSPVRDYGGKFVAMKGKVLISEYYFDEYALIHEISDVYYVLIE